MGELQRGVFKILLDYPDGLPAKEVLARLERVVPPTEFEKNTYPKRPDLRRFEEGRGGWRAEAISAIFRQRGARTMSPTVYLDQDALIRLYRESLKVSAFKGELEKAIGDERITMVLSPWHWVETSRTQNLGKALPLAEFMDWLRPSWLRDRRHLETTEVENKFFQFAAIPYTAQKALVTRAELLTEMNGFPVTPERAPSSREFVEGWIKAPKLMEPIVDSYQRNVRALVGLREALALGKVTSEMMKEGDRKYIERHLPNSTPNGVVLDRGTKNAFLDKAAQNDFPTLAIESEIAEYSWANRGRTDWNSMIDKFHVISSTPYTDIVVSDDRFFYLLLPSARKTGHVKAKVMKFGRFCAEFLP